MIASPALVTGKRAPYGFGTVVIDTDNAREATCLAGMDWTTERKPVFLQHSNALRPEDAFTELSGFQAIVRSDRPTEAFHVPTDSWTPFQNLELVQLAYDIAGMTEGTVESCGTLKGGRLALALIRTGSFHVGIGDADRNDNYCLLTAAHDGTRAVQGRQFTHRPACTNVISSPAAFSFRHSSGIQEAIAEALEGYATVVDQGLQWAAQAQAMAAKPLSLVARSEFFRQAHEAAYGLLPVLDSTSAQKAHHKAQEKIADWTANLEDPLQSLAGNQGTLWACLNSITQWADHSSRIRTTQGTPIGEARIANRLFGSGASVKAAALATALGVLG